MYIIIVNPKAGYGKAEKIFRRIQKDPLFKNKNCRTFLTSYAGHAEKISEQVAEIHHETLKCIIVVGGDGTLHEVINGSIHRPQIPVAFIPAGSGNDFARGLGIKLKGADLFRRIVSHPKRYNIRSGEYVTNQRYKHGKRVFLNSIGFGLDGEIVELANRPRYRKWLRRFRLHRFTYPIALLRLLRTFEPISFELEVDGRKSRYQKATMVTITNHPYYGGGMKISPKAHIQKPTFSILIIGPISRLKILGLFLTVFIGKHTKLKEVTELEGHSVHIRSKTPLFYQVDGQGGQCLECDVKKTTRSTSIHAG